MQLPRLTTSSIRYSLILLGLLLKLNTIPAVAQTLTVRGLVKTATEAVQNARLIFKDNLDTNRKYTTLTDPLGYYQVTIPTVAVASQTFIPHEFAVEQNYPNPFATTTAIPYALPRQAAVYVTIYDLLGREVRHIIVGQQLTGRYTVLWDGCNNAGQKVASGLYFYRLKAGNETRIKKLIFAGDGNTALPTMPSSADRLTKAHNVSLAMSFIVQIENTDETTPLIVPQQFPSVSLDHDTTLNFTVMALPVCTVYIDSLKQSIRGFGGANILQWRPDMTADQVRKAFGTGEGEIGFSILRLRVPYDLTEYTLSMQVPTAKLAQSYGAIVFASPWTPPAALKTNNNIVGGELKESAYAAYAAHLKTFVDYMASQGAPLYAISIQNEPDITVTYESCDWSPAQMTKFIAENAPSIGTRILAPESFQFRRPISDAILSDSTACAHLDIVGGHIYGGGIESYPLAEEKGKEIWMTEHLDTDTSWSAVLATGKEINDCLNVGMNAYVWWYIVRFYGPILENGAVSKRGYVMSQFARFVRPGFRRIKCTAIPQRNLYVTAFRNDSGKVVLVAINTGSNAIDQTFQIPLGMMTSFASYTTSRTKNCQRGTDYTVTSDRFTARLEASSITTFVSN